MTQTRFPPPAEQPRLPEDPDFSADAEGLIPPSEAEPASTGGVPHKLTAIDLFRGITILEVVAHHTSGLALRYAVPDTLSFMLLQLINRTLHFAVPAFVFLSAVVLTRSLLKNFRPGRYFWRRLTRGAWPYLLWSALYMGWYVWTGQRPASTLTDPDKWLFYLQYGKASYHLYFLLVALEVYLVIPLLLPLARRRPPIVLALLLGAALQLGIYLLNRSVLRVPYPASTVLWYMLPITVGMAVGARLDDFPAWWRKYRLVLIAAAATAYALYLPQALAYVRGEPLNPMVYSGLSWAYTTLMALTVLGVAYSLQRLSRRWRVGLGTIGMFSLQIYLIHPAILQTLERLHSPGGDPLVFALTTLGYFLLALLLPAMLALLLVDTRLSKFIFGR
ncbi:acyltransferase [Deinococcus radiopugnans]|uniref:Acyltransferase n=1 Tax=Deinococcus radiopugnans ATCC 19172 TaxID=585398 RepID=A0A5C4XY85_9DEIO|nr:acyltransferase [Deinococcus radiopugnans]MBB6018162.1 peptidoglycan/LPS O-acetylase OafA/YrhL [Deinococcus radiopugnans ATCC 19172]TNM68241.1 acyltransferase [Deinococcus radiopugnans ATCC 19172]